MSTPSTGRPSASAATERALPPACSHDSTDRPRASPPRSAEATTSKGMPQLLEDRAPLRRRRRQEEWRRRRASARACARPRSPRTATARPLGGDVVVVARASLRVLRRPQLVQRARPRNRCRAASGSIAVRRGGTRRPSSPGHSMRSRPNCGRSSRSSAVPSSGRAQDRRARVAQEDESAARPEQPRRLGDPPVRIGPDGRAVLGEDEVEGLVGQRDALGARLDERELDRLRLHPRAVASCAGVGSTPTGRAPRRASHAENTRSRSRARRRPCP